MSENTNHQYSMVGIFMLKIGERMKIKDMERLTHKRENGIKRGYWSPNKKQELVDRLAMYEDREDAKDINVLGKWIPCSERLPENAMNVIAQFSSGTVTELRYAGDKRAYCRKEGSLVSSREVCVDCKAHWLEQEVDE